MGVRILHDESGDEDMACLYDSVTETAFGRIFHGDQNGDRDAWQIAEAFLEWYAKHGKERDPRIESDIGKVQDDWLELDKKGAA